MTAASAQERTNPLVTVSIVSHNQGALTSVLLQDLKRISHTTSLEVILTLNTDEAPPDLEVDVKFPVQVIYNPEPLGFGANHNQAFVQAKGDFYCVMNPDVRLEQDPFTALLLVFNDPTVALAAPLVKDNAGRIEDSARQFPSPAKIMCRAVGRCKNSDYDLSSPTTYPDWVGGMFMLFPSTVFKEFKGFDERFFLYYEDVDLCARLKLRDKKIVLCSTVSVTHQAQRNSHRHFTYFRWHVASMVRFFSSTVYRQMRRNLRTAVPTQPSHNSKLTR